MPRNKSYEQIVKSLLDLTRQTIPEADVKPGEVIRDLFIDLPSNEIAKLWNELNRVSERQAVVSATGSDLDRIAANYGLTRNTGTVATGVVVFTFNTVDVDLTIPRGTVVAGRNGIKFTTLSDIEIDSSRAAVYRANAIRLQSDLEIANITDQYAVEGSVEATSPGVAGRLGKYSIVSQAIPGVSNVTNTQAFSGGTSSESDSSFRSRILNSFAGNNIGTSTSYLNALLTNSNVVDAFSVEPGDPLMTRDGTDVVVDSDGNRIIVTAGTGGKVDLYIQGGSLETNTESFIYRDNSGKSDPTDPSNDYVLGQNGIDSNLSYAQKRRDYADTGVAPLQPVSQVLSISGTLSGPNFIEQFTDTDGKVKGNFKLTKDSGDFGGSPFGFDKIQFISKTIDLENELTTKGTFNGKDPLDYTDAQDIDSVTQNTLIYNEAPEIDSSDRSILKLKHDPILSVDKITNVTTGERYIISNTNLDGNLGDLNTTGRIQISGGTLPAASDILQANYTWRQEYDRYLDYDDIESDNILRNVEDSVDWGFSNRIKEEEQTVVYSVGDGYHVVVNHPVSRVIDVYTNTKETVAVSSATVTTSSTVSNVASIKSADGEELFNTKIGDGSFSGTVITLPTDTLATNGQNVDVTYNQTDIYSPDGYDVGSFSNNKIILTGFSTLGATVFVNYVGNVSSFLPTTSLSTLPASRSLNQFLVNGSLTGAQPVSDIFDGYGVSQGTLRFSPSYLKMNLAGVLNSGRLSVSGTSIQKIETTFTSLTDGLELDLGYLIRQELGLDSLPNTMFISSVSKLERVTLSNGVVSSVDHEYDLLNYKLLNNSLSNKAAVSDNSLLSTQFALSSTAENLTQNISTGSTYRVVMYVANSNQVERVTVSASGRQYTKYKYAYVDTISVDSGFANTSGTVEGTLSVGTSAQPDTSSQYFVSYSYSAPKEGERLTISYNTNALISDALALIEPVRPITADVLTKAASAKPVDVSVTVVVTSTFSGSTTNLTQTVQENISSFLSSSGLNSTIDESDVVNSIYSVNGIDRVEITKFIEEGGTGKKRSIYADRNEYITSGTIEVITGER